MKGQQTEWVDSKLEIITPIYSNRSFMFDPFLPIYGHICQPDGSILYSLLLKNTFSFHIFPSLLSLSSTTLRVSRSAKLEDTEGSKSVSYLGRKGKEEFEFSDLPFKVEFVACSARGKGEEESCVAEIDPIREWIDKQC